MFNDNSTRLAYRKICRRVILFYNGMANKESRSIDEQIELLKQRGMLVGDEGFAARHLAHISYYRLKGYWWDMQSDRANHLFQPDSKLEDVITRYYFDKELRLILFDAIETIEITLRTIDSWQTINLDDQNDCSCQFGVEFIVLRTRPKVVCQFILVENALHSLILQKHWC